MFIAPGEVQRQHTRNAYSCTQTIAVARMGAVPIPACSKAKHSLIARADPFELDRLLFPSS
jgi:hypothetical protein